MSEDRVVMSARSARLLGVVELAIATTEQVLAQIEPGQWHVGTPCEEMDAHAVVEHLVSGLVQFAEAAEGRPFAQPDVSRHFADGTAMQAYDLAGDRLLSAWSEPGRLDATYSMPWGESTGRQLLAFMLIEQVVHGWDLMRATGHDVPWDDDVVEAALDFAVEFDHPSVRVPGMFGPIVPVGDGAPLVDRLAAFLGRNPATG